MERDCKGWHAVASSVCVYLCVCVFVSKHLFPRNCIISMSHGEKKRKNEYNEFKRQSRTRTEGDVHSI